MTVSGICSGYLTVRLSRFRKLVSVTTDTGTLRLKIPSICKSIVHVKELFFLVSKSAYFFLFDIFLKERMST